MVLEIPKKQIREFLNSFRKVGLLCLVLVMFWISTVLTVAKNPINKVTEVQDMTATITDLMAGPNKSAFYPTHFKPAASAKLAPETESEHQESPSKSKVDLDPVNPKPLRKSDDDTEHDKPTAPTNVTIESELVKPASPSRTGSEASSTTNITKTPYAPALRKGPDSVRGLECIRILEGSQTTEGIGAVFKRNQVAVLLASYYKVKLQFPELMSIHGYNYADMFDNCNHDMSDEFRKRCTLYLKDILFEYCTRGDCDCMAGQYATHLQRVVDRGCPTVGIQHDGFKRIEFSGCLPLLKRYFGTKGPPPDWEYNAIHYRMGDLADKPGGKSFSIMELWVLIKMMCLMSDRDIVVVTEGKPEIPECGNRIVLADTSIEYSMQIFQHAKFVAAGVSSFAYILMEFASPERVVIKTGHVLRYEFVDCENWTLVDSKTGATLHFDSKKAMVDMMSSSRKLEFEWTVRKRKEFAAAEIKTFNMSVPKRIWEPSMMKPAVLRCSSCN